MATTTATTTAPEIELERWAPDDPRRKAPAPATTTREPAEPGSFDGPGPDRDDLDQAWWNGYSRGYSRSPARPPAEWHPARRAAFEAGRSIGLSDAHRDA